MLFKFSEFKDYITFDIPGKTYNNKLCYHSLDNVLQVYEWSLVNDLENIK